MTHTLLAGLSHSGYPPQASTDPFPPPTTPVTVMVPTGAGWTDGSNAVANIQALITANPTGTEFVFPGSAYTYNISTAIIIDGRSNLRFSGHGTHLNNTGDYNHAGLANSAFVIGRFVGGSRDIVIDDFVIHGANPSGGTQSAYHLNHETASGVMIFNRPLRIEVKNCVISDQWGHGIYQGSGGSGAANAPQYTWLHDNTIERVGVMGINTACAVYSWIEDNTITDTAIYPIDFEDGISGEPMQHVYVRRNALDGWAWEPTYEAHAIVGDTGVGMVWSDVIIEGNVLTRGDLGTIKTSGYTAGVISFYGSDNKVGLQVIDNTSDHLESSSGTPPTTWAWRFRNCPSGLVVTGNTQLIAGTTVFAHLDNCPGAVTTPNTN